jgi:hypothetical protein
MSKISSGHFGEARPTVAIVKRTLASLGSA